MPEPSKVLLITPEEIRKRVVEIAGELSSQLAGRDILLLGILKGAFIFLSDLARQMTQPVEVDFIRLSSYGGSSQSSGAIRLTKEPECQLAGKSVVVVEDIVDTGLTMEWLLDYLRKCGVTDAKVCTLIDKAERRDREVKIDHVGFHLPRGFLVGYGLDFNERYRELPGLYELKFSGEE